MKTRIRLSCTVSGLPLGTLDVDFSPLSTLPAQNAAQTFRQLPLLHPIFFSPRRSILQMAGKMLLAAPDAETAEEESRQLILLALLHSTGRLIIAPTHAPQLPCPTATKREFSRLVSLVNMLHTIDSERLKIPFFKVSSDNAMLENVGAWINAAFSCIDEFSQTREAAQDAAKIKAAQVAKKRMEDAIKTGMQTRPAALWQWVEVQLAPRHAPWRADWKKLFCSEKPVSLNVKIEHITAFEDALLATIDTGNILSHAAFARIKGIKKQIVDFYTCYTLSDAYTFTDTQSPLSGLQAPQSIVAISIQPVRSDYPSDFAFKRAVAAWSLTQKGIVKA